MWVGEVATPTGTGGDAITTGGRSSASPLHGSPASRVSSARMEVAPARHMDKHRATSKAVACEQAPEDDPSASSKIKIVVRRSASGPRACSQASRARDSLKGVPFPVNSLLAGKVDGQFGHQRLRLELLVECRIVEGRETLEVSKCAATRALSRRQSGQSLVGGKAGGGDWKHHSLDISHLRCISQKCTPHVPHLIDLRLFCEAASPQHSHALSTRLNSIEHALSAEDLKSCCRVGSRAKATCPRLLTTCGWL